MLDKGRLLWFALGAALATAAMRALPIPTVVHSTAGDIPITWVPKIRCGTIDARGCYSAELRQVWILSGMSHDSTLQTIRHEQCHISLDDAGLEVDGVTFTRDSSYYEQGGPEDYVCDALGWAWLAEKQHGH